MPLIKKLAKVYPIPAWRTLFIAQLDVELFARLAVKIENFYTNSFFKRILAIEQNKQITFRPSFF